MANDGKRITRNHGNQAAMRKLEKKYNVNNPEKDLKKLQELLRQKHGKTRVSKAGGSPCQTATARPNGGSVSASRHLDFQFEEGDNKRITTHTAWKKSAVSQLSTSSRTSCSKRRKTSMDSVICCEMQKDAILYPTNCRLQRAQLPNTRKFNISNRATPTPPSIDVAKTRELQSQSTAIG